MRIFTVRRISMNSGELYKVVRSGDLYNVIYISKVIYTKWKPVKTIIVRFEKLLKKEKGTWWIYWNYFIYQLFMKRDYHGIAKTRDIKIHVEIIIYKLVNSEN